MEWIDVGRKQDPGTSVRVERTKMLTTELIKLLGETEAQLDAANLRNLQLEYENQHLRKILPQSTLKIDETAKSALEKIRENIAKYDAEILQLLATICEPQAMFERVKILDTTHLADALIGSKAANEHSDEAEEIASPEEFSPDDRESFEIVEDPSSRSSCSSSTTFLDLNEQNDFVETVGQEVEFSPAHGSRMHRECEKDTSMLTSRILEKAPQVSADGPIPTDDIIQQISKFSVHDAYIIGDIKIRTTYAKNTLTLEVIEANNLKPAGRSSGFAYPYCQISLVPDRPCQYKQRTRQIQTPNPEWSESFLIYIDPHELLSNRVAITIWDRLCVDSNDFFGEVVVDLADSTLMDGTARWYPLQAKQYEMFRAA